MNRLSRRGLILITIALATIGIAARPASAQTQFADFSIAGGSPFTYDNSSGVFSASTTGFMSFQNLDLSDTPYASAIGGINAKLELTAQTLGNTLSSNNGLGVYQLSLKITDDDSRFGQIGKNLLSVSVAPGTTPQGTLLFNPSNVNVGSLTADTPTDNVIYTSDFLNFTNDPSVIRSLIVGMSSINQTGNPDTSLGFAPGPNGRPVSFNSGGGINFSTNRAPTRIPEGNAGLLMGTTISMLGGFILIRRKR